MMNFLRKIRPRRRNYDEIDGGTFPESSALPVPAPQRSSSDDDDDAPYQRLRIVHFSHFGCLVVACVTCLVCGQQQSNANYEVGGDQYCPLFHRWLLLKVNSSHLVLLNAEGAYDALCGVAEFGFLAAGIFAGIFAWLQMFIRPKKTSYRKKFRSSAPGLICFETLVCWATALFVLGLMIAFTLGTADWCKSFAQFGGCNAANKVFAKNPSTKLMQRVDHYYEYMMVSLGFGWSGVLAWLLASILLLIRICARMDFIQIPYLSIRDQIRADSPATDSESKSGEKVSPL